MKTLFFLVSLFILLLLVGCTDVALEKTSEPSIPKSAGIPLDSKFLEDSFDDLATFEKLASQTRS